MLIVKGSFWSRIAPKSRTDVEKVKCGYLTVREDRSILESWLGMPS